MDQEIVNKFGPPKDGIKSTIQSGADGSDDSCNNVGSCEDDGVNNGTIEADEDGITKGDGISDEPTQDVVLTDAGSDILEIGDEVCDEPSHDTDKSRNDACKNNGTGIDSINVEADDVENVVENTKKIETSHIDTNVVEGDESSVIDVDEQVEVDEPLIIDEDNIAIESNNEANTDEKEEANNLPSSQSTPQAVKQSIYQTFSGSDATNKHSSFGGGKDSTLGPLVKVKSPVVRRSRVSDSKISAESMEAWNVPFKNGWKREVVNRNVTNGKRSQCDIYYFSPTGKKLRSMVEIETWLSDNRNPLTLNNFSFARMAISEPPFETVRDAGKSRRSTNTSLNDGTPTEKPKLTVMKRPDKRSIIKPLRLQDGASFRKEVAFKTVLLSTSVGGPEKNQNIVHVDNEASISNTMNRPKIKYVPKVKNSEILLKLLEKTGTKNKVKNPEIISRLMKKTAAKTSFLKRLRPVSPDWEPSDSDSDGERLHTPVRNVEVIKYTASDQASVVSSNDGDEIQNVLGTPSKLISSIVNPAPPPTSVPIPFSLDSRPSGTVKFQIVTKKNAKPEEIFAQLGLNKTNYRIVTTSSLPSQINPSNDNRPVVKSSENLQPITLYPKSSMPSLLVRPPVVTGPNPVISQIILPPPPPLSQRPGLSRPAIVPSVIRSILPPLHRPGTLSHAIPLLIAPPQLHSPMIRPINPPLQPHPQTLKTLLPSQPQISYNKPPTPIVEPVPSSSGGSNPPVSVGEKKRSSTPELTDFIFNDLSNFLGIGSKTNFQGKYPSIPSSQISLLSNPPLLQPNYNPHHFNQNVLKGSVNQGTSNNGNKSFLGYSKPSDHIDEESEKSQQEKDKIDQNDSDNEDSMLPVSFGPLHKQNGPDHLPNTSNGCLPSKVTDVLDSSAIGEIGNSTGNLSEDARVRGEPVKEKNTDVSIPPLSRREFLVFKLLQNNVSAMLSIFEQLPMCDLLRVSRVCKSWRRISMMKPLWQNVAVKTVYENYWQRAVKFFIEVGVTNLSIGELPDKGKPGAIDAMITALSKMTQLKRLQFNIVPQHILSRVMQSMPHLQNVGAEFIVDSEPLQNSNFTWTTISKEFAMAKAVDAIMVYGKTVTEAASICSVPEAELKHLMLTDPSPLQKEEGEAVLLCCMRLAHMGFSIDLAVLEARLEEEVSKRPQPCQPSPHIRKLFCHRLLQRNGFLFKNDLPYKLSASVSSKLSLYSKSLGKLYQDINVKNSSSVLAFTMDRFSVLNPAGNRICNVTALSVISAANITLPAMLIFPNVVHYPETISNLILVGSKEGTATPNLITHYLRAVFTEINVRPLVVFFNGHESILSHQLISESINSSVFLQCVPQDISKYSFPGNFTGILHSVGKSLKGSLVKERNFIELMCKEINASTKKNVSPEFAKAGLFPTVMDDPEMQYLPNDWDSESEGDSDKVEEDNIGKENVLETENDTQSNKSSLSSKPNSVLDSHNAENNNNNHTVSSVKFDHLPSSSCLIDSTATGALANAKINTDLINDGKGKGGLLFPFRTQNRPRGRGAHLRSRRINFCASLINNRDKRLAKETKNDSEQDLCANGNNLNDPKISEKRPFDLTHDTDSKMEEVPFKRPKECKMDSSSLSLIEQTIDEVIAQSRAEADAKEKEENQEDSRNDNKDSKDVPVRPALRIRLSSHGLISVLSNSMNAKDLSEEAGDDKKIEEKERVDSSEEEEECGDKEMEVEDDNSEIEMKDESDLKTSYEEGNTETSEIVDENDDDEIKDESIDTSHVMEDDSEPDMSTEQDKAVKKKKKKKHHRHSSKEEKDENNSPKKKKKKKKRSKRAKKTDEKTEEELAVVDIASPPKESTPEKVVETEDEHEKNLLYIRRISLADHDYQTKFDSDSGTEAVKDDDVEENHVQEIQLASEEGTTNVDASSNPVELGVVEFNTEHAPSVQVGSEDVGDKNETSDSDSSSSNDDSDHESGSSSSGSGSSPSRSSSTGSSSSNSNSDKEEEEEEVKVVNVTGDKSDEGEENEKEKSDSDDGSSSSSDNASSSDSDNDVEGEQSNDADGEDDSKCQLCMLANPPHSKDMIIDWVDCDGNCGRWFHVICITRAQSKANPKHYVCPSCRCKR